MGIRQRSKPWQPRCPLAKCDTAAALVNQRKQELDAYVENVKRKGAQAVGHVTGLFSKGQENK